MILTSSSPHLSTDPSVFGFEPGRPVISLSLAGLYQITFGFFARKRPLVQVSAALAQGWWRGGSSAVAPTAGSDSSPNKREHGQQDSTAGIEFRAATGVKMCS